MVVHFCLLWGPRARQIATRIWLATTPKTASMERFSTKKSATVQWRFGDRTTSAARMKSFFSLLHHLWSVKIQPLPIVVFFFFSKMMTTLVGKSECPFIFKKKKSIFSVLFFFLSHYYNKWWWYLKNWSFALSASYPTKIGILKWTKMIKTRINALLKKKSIWKYIKSQKKIFILQKIKRESRKKRFLIR